MNNLLLKRWSVASLLALCCAGHLPGTEPPPATGESILRPPQGLPRLAGLPERSGGKRIPAEAISIVNLDTPQSAGRVGRISSQGEIRYLALPPSSEWNIALRPQRAGANYVTFTIQASVGSVISVDGAQVALLQSDRPGYAAVHAGYAKDGGVEWMPLLHDVELQPYSGQLMGTLAIVTICADTEASHWSISMGDRLIAHDLPLDTAPAGIPRTLSVRTGEAGAWVSGVAASEENPVFEDMNHNGVRDSFERKILGKILERDASPETRARLLKVWKERSYLEPSDYALMTKNGSGEADWENIPAEFHLDIPAFDRTEQPAVRGIPGIPTAIIHK